MGVHPARPRVRTRPVDGIDRRLLRQRLDGIVLGTDADRLLDRQRWRTRLELANAIFDYLEIFHNRQRRHSSIGMLTPNEYEKLYHQARMTGSTHPTPVSPGHIKLIHNRLIGHWSYSPASHRSPSQTRPQLHHLSDTPPCQGGQLAGVDHPACRRLSRAGRPGYLALQPTDCQVVRDRPSSTRKVRRCLRMAAVHPETPGSTSGVWAYRLGHHFDRCERRTQLSHGARPIDLGVMTGDVVLGVMG